MNVLVFLRNSAGLPKKFYKDSIVLKGIPSGFKRDSISIQQGALRIQQRFLQEFYRDSKRILYEFYDAL